MRILITNGSGMLGRKLNKVLSQKHSILSFYHKNTGNIAQYNSVQADITDFVLMDSVFGDFKPEVVIHNAAISSSADVDKLSVKLVNDTNISATQKIAELSKKLSAKLIYTSTDLVYAGYRGMMLDENSKLAPISLYAESKLMGEIKVRESANNYIILRMAIMYGIGEGLKKNHINIIYEKLKQGESVKLFDDQYRTPISFSEAATTIAYLIDKNIENEIINLGGPERVSRYELGKILCEEAGFNTSLLIPNSMDDVEGIYKVADVSMNTGKLTSYGVKLNNLRDSVKLILGEL